MNFDPVLRKQAYKVGLLDIPEKEYVKVKGKQVLRDWTGAPGVMPFKPVEESDGPVSLDTSESNREQLKAWVFAKKDHKHYNKHH